jgi:tetratricopeptide (TPR) repeat protein
MDYNRLIEDHPDNAQLHNNRADLYLQMHIYDEAMKGVNVALEIAPDYNIALVTKGQIYYGLGDYEQACIYFKKALTNGFGRSGLTEYLHKCEPILMDE